MSLREEIKNILKENPEIIAEVLKLRPDILYDAIIKLTPWEKLVINEDLKLLIELINKRFEDMRYYLDKRIGFLEKLIIGFNIPILVGIIIALIRLFV
jgi:hypothetical protein